MREPKLVAKVIYDESHLLYMPMIVPILHSFCDAVEVYALDDSKSKMPVGLMGADLRVNGSKRDCYQQALSNTAPGSWVMFWDPTWLPTENMKRNLKYTLSNNRQTSWNVSRYYACDIINKQLFINSTSDMIKNFVFKYHVNMMMNDDLTVADHDLIKGQPLKNSVGIIDLGFGIDGDREPLPQGWLMNANVNWLTSIQRQRSR